MSRLWRWIRGWLGFAPAPQSVDPSKDQPEGHVQAFDCIQQDRVRQELGLSHDQIGLIGMHTREIRQKYRDEFARLQDLPEEKRRMRRRQVRTLIAGEVMRLIYEAGILTDPQRRRFRQILWQHRGIRAFVDPLVCDALRLRVPQKEAILTILGETRKKVGALAREGPRSEEIRFESESLREEALEKVMEVLSEEQRQRWEELKGVPFAANVGGGMSPPIDPMD